MQRYTIFLVLWSVAAAVEAGEWRGSVTAEYRGFVASALDPDQHDGTASVIIEPEYYHSWDNERQALMFKPFYRWDQRDSERTHADVRELFWLYVGDRFEVRVGVRKVFWGVTESQHLVDILNQTDLLENPDGEDKLGQPMLSTTWLTDWGNLELYVLPYFRERTFPGETGRLRSLPRIETNEDALYEHNRKEKHVDWAARWSQTFGSWDVGISHFYGTNREPRLQAGVNRQGEPVLVPFYELIHQTGVDVQGAVGPWLWKWEAIHRDGQQGSFFATTAGLEYTFYSANDTPLDVGIVVEYLYDDRGAAATTSTDDDLMLGLRLTPNDAQSTEFLLGVILDRDTDARIYRLEASRRLTDRLKINLEAAAYSGLPVTDPLYTYRQDDYLQVGITYYY